MEQVVAVKKKLTKEEKIALLSPIAKEGRKGFDLDSVTGDIKRKKDGTYTDVNARKRHEAVGEFFKNKGDADERRSVEAKLPPARACNFCGEEKRDFRDDFTSANYRLCKDCEDHQMLTGEPLGEPKFVDAVGEVGPPEQEEEME